MCSRRACLRGSASSNAAVIAIARLRRPSVGGRWLFLERPNETPPVTSDAGLSLLTTQCRFFEGCPWSPDPGPFEPGSDSAALTPASLRLESDEEDREPPSLTRPSAQLEIRGAPPGHTFRGGTLQRCRPGRARCRTRIHGLQVDLVDQYPAALRDWIMSPCGSRSRREVDLP